VNDKKRSLGRDVFGKSPQGEKSKALKKMLEATGDRGGPKGTKEVEVRVKLTPSNIKHLDTLVAELERQGKGRFTRSELIRVAIALLSAGDF
jgi:hypothetical protein